MYIKFVGYTSEVLHSRHIFSCLFQTTFHDYQSRTKIYNLRKNLKRTPPAVQ
jgi:hypothetical protein